MFTCPLKDSPKVWQTYSFCGRKFVDKTPIFHRYSYPISIAFYNLNGAQFRCHISFPYRETPWLSFQMLNILDLQIFNSNSSFYSQPVLEIQAHIVPQLDNDLVSDSEDDQTCVPREPKNVYWWWDWLLVCASRNR